MSTLAGECHNTPLEDDVFCYPDPSEQVPTTAEQHGVYSTRMDELFEDGDMNTSERHEDDEEVFVYNGLDASDANKGYRDHLRDVLGPELTDDDEIEICGMDESLLGSNVIRDDDDPIHGSPTGSPASVSLSDPRTPQFGSPAASETLWSSRPHVHPSVSRLRSHAPQLSQTPSQSGVSSNNEDASRFSVTSRESSVSNPLTKCSDTMKDDLVFPGHPNCDVFAWTELRSIGEEMYNHASRKLSSVLGAPYLGFPTVMVANGLICIGTDQGKICVYDLKQTLRCICGKESPVKNIGAVTALALSYDHTYLASGHAMGYIQLFDLKSPHKPARLVPPITWTAIASGRKEGHIEGSRIISIGFLAGRHTAIVSADDHGMAFVHSLSKFLFVEAPDILRILGKYRNRVSFSQIDQAILDTTLPRHNRAGSRTSHAILEMLPLPLGTSSHPTDSYNIVALLTLTKLVVVGLKPTPKTWFKCMRKSRKTHSNCKGTMAWYPSVLPQPSEMLNGNQEPMSTCPLLLYTWENEIHIICIKVSRSKELVKNRRTGHMVEVEAGRIEYDTVAQWAVKDNVLAVQWLNANQILTLLPGALQVFDTQICQVVEQTPFDAFSLMTPTLKLTVNESIPYSHSIGDIKHSLRVYEEKLFVLGRNNIRVGTLLTWADRILSLVEDGDFLQAIDLARAYYLGEAPGNRNGLPSNPNLCKAIIGERMQALMTASTSYVFSEDRMSDGTHVTSDGRGVDRTSLFENLVVVCSRACLALNTFEFLFEDLFHHYDEAGISKIYLEQLEPFILEDQIRYVPPRIVQALITLHEEDGDPIRVERIIWHIDPACLDINQVICLCQKYALYDALIYVYTRALQDSVAPIVELLGLIRRVQQRRHSKTESSGNPIFHHDVESLIFNAYKVYPYLGNVLTGLSHPAGEILCEEESYQSKKSVYAFLFSGTSCVWPPGDIGKLILTSVDDGLPEPTYPYVRSLLSFDSESFLHSLDIAFEDPYLNEESNGTSRLVIIKILLELLSSGDLDPGDANFVNIFIARNVPKYPQFLLLAPSALHNILISLAEYADPGTREDRQLATEFLLSAYNPHESEHIIPIFRTAGFYRILRIWHHHEGRWSDLASIDLDDPNLSSSDRFRNLNHILTSAARDNDEILPAELIQIISDAIPRLLKTSPSDTATLINDHAPNLHEFALHSFDEDDLSRLLYLRHLLDASEQTEGVEVPTIITTIPKLSHSVRKLYISLESQYSPGRIIEDLQCLPPDFLDMDEVIQICEVNRVYEAVVWTMHRRGNAQAALVKAEEYQKNLVRGMVDAMNSGPAHSKVNSDLETLKKIVRIGTNICRTYSKAGQMAIEDIWLPLLSSQIKSIHTLSASRSIHTWNASEEKAQSEAVYEYALTTLRALVQSTFSSLVSMPSAHTVSFPQLFARLVNSASVYENKQYTEFRMILTGMLESYRSEGDMLLITKRLLDRDLFEFVSEVTRQRQKGWSPSQHACTYCHKMVLGSQHNDSSSKIIVSRTGTMYHSTCPPLEIYRTL